MSKRPTPAGRAALRPQYMTPEQTADLVQRVRATAAPAPLPPLKTLTKSADPRCKFSSVDIAAIRRARANGRPLRLLAAEYDISKSHISRVALGRGRREAPGPLMPWAYARRGDA